MGSATHDKRASRRRGFGHSRVRVLRHALLGVALVSAIGFTSPATAGAANAAVALRATVTLTPTSATINQVVTAGLAKSTRPVGDTLSKITLTWGDGSKAVTLANLNSRPSHRYVRPGHFTVTASITDQHGITAHGAAVEVVTPPVGSYSGSAVGVNYGAPVKFYVSGNHAQVQDVSIPTLYLNCMPGNTWPADAIVLPAITLAANGSFSTTSTQSGVWRGYPATFTYVFNGRVNGVDASGAARAAGLVRETLRFSDSTARTCTSNNVAWAVTREAQPSQPTTLPPRGSYSGNALGVNYGAPVKFYVSSNRTQLQDLSIPTLSLNCSPGGANVSSPVSIASIALNADGSFRSTTVQSGVWNNNPATFTYVFRGHFHGVDSSGTPRAAGLVRETVTFTDTAAHTCTSNNLGWATARDAQPAQPTTLPPDGNYSGSAIDVNYGAPVTFTVSGAILQTVSVPNVYMGCAPGTTTAFSPISVSSIVLNADGSFSSTTTQSGVYSGHAATFTYVFNGHFHGVDHLGNARAAGQFSETLTFTDTAARTCMSNPHSWTATL
jgi:hypothetical protein